MKKNIFILILVMFMFCTSVSAAECSFEDQIKVSGLATSTKIEYTMHEYTQEYFDPTYDETIMDSTWGGILYIYNMSPELRAEVIDYNGNKKNYYFTDAEEGTVALSTGTAMKVKNYTVNIYAVNSDCGKDALKTVNITIPRFNQFSLYNQCANYPDYYYCKEFVTLDEISEQSFYNGVNSYIEQQEKQKEEEEKKNNSIIYKTTEFIKEHKGYIISAVIVLVICGGLVTYVVIKKRRRRLV